jgi:hypothetical protein
MVASDVKTAAGADPGLSPNTKTNRQSQGIILALVRLGESGGRGATRSETAEKRLWKILMIVRAVDLRMPFRQPSATARRGQGLALNTGIRLGLKDKYDMK